MKRKKAGNRHTGATFDSFLIDEGILAEAEAVALKRVFAWQISKAMDARKMTKQALAARLKTSRSQVDRLLDPEYVGVSLSAAAKAARAVGKQMQIVVAPLNGDKRKVRAAS